MKKSLALILATLFISACSFSATAPEWHHRDQSGPIQMERALSDCHMYLDAAQESGASPTHRQVQEWYDEFIECMAERGWDPVKTAR